MQPSGNPRLEISLIGGVMKVHLNKPSENSSTIPFSPSWIDRLVVSIDRLPGSAWIVYVLSVLSLGVLINAVFWIDGSIQIGSIDPSNTAFALFIVYWVGLYQYLTGIGARSLKEFRPLLDVDDSEITRIKYELATLPRWIGLLSIPLGYGVASAMTLGDPAPYGAIIPRTALPYVGDIAISGFMLSTFICLVTRCVRQLRLVSRLHARASNINLLKLEPAHAFSTLTSRTGIGIIFVLIFSIPLNPAPFDSALSIFIAIMTLLLAIAVFVLPIIGIRHHLEVEKRRILDSTSDLLQTSSDRLHHLIQGDKYQDIVGTKEAMEALIRERELIEKTSTWPWNLSTLRGFTSALLLPIILWLATRLLEKFLSL
jgi:hypothetical protein